MSKKTSKKNSLFEKFAEGHSHENAKYYGDLYLDYEDFCEGFNDKIKYIMFGRMMSPNYIGFKYSSYGAYKTLLGNYIAQFIIQQQMNDPKYNPQLNENLPPNNMVEPNQKHDQMYR